VGSVLVGCVAIVADHIMMQEDFERLHMFLETDSPGNFQRSPQGDRRRMAGAGVQAAL
jgi:hypothetical protein